MHESMETLAAAIGSVPRFQAALVTTGWFGDDALWLAPVPTEQFRALTDAVAKAFPTYPPYRGEHADVVPHLTVGQGVEVAPLREAEGHVLSHLPIPWMSPPPHGAGNRCPGLVAAGCHLATRAHGGSPQAIESPPHGDTVATAAQGRELTCRGTSPASEAPPRLGGLPFEHGNYRAACPAPRWRTHGLDV